MVPSFPSMVEGLNFTLTLAMGLLFGFVRNRLVLDGLRLAVQFSLRLFFQPCLLGQGGLSPYRFLVGFPVLTHLSDPFVIPARSNEVLKFRKLLRSSLSFPLDITVLQIIIGMF